MFPCATNKLKPGPVMKTERKQEDLPAILGGSPAITLDQTEANRWPVITSEDEQSVLEVLRSGELSIHPVVCELENEFRQRLGIRHAIAHNNGTGAIHAALYAFGLQPGDEVIVPSATWWASVLPVLHQGAVPVFAESDAETGGLDPADVEAKITVRTKAMVVVHLFGMPSKMEQLLRIARDYDLKILEDASHAHGATYGGQKIGTFGEAAVFSMQCNKLLPSAEGGILVTNDDELIEKALCYGHYERLLSMKGLPVQRFAATGFGHKCRISPLSAAMARAQLRYLDERNAGRNRNCEYVSEGLEKLGCFQLFRSHAGVERVYFEFLVTYRSGPENLPLPLLVKALEAEGANIRAPRYPLLHQQPVFTEGHWKRIAQLTEDDPAAQRRYDPADLPKTVAMNARLLRLPAFPNASRELLDQYLLAFRKVVGHAGEIGEEAL